MALDAQIAPALQATSMNRRSGTGAPIFEAGPHTRIRRNPTRAIASFHWDGGPREVYGQILDISLHGGLLQTAATIPEGTRLHLTITLVGHGEEGQYELRGIVRRRQQSRDRQTYGLEFLTESSKERQIAQALYSHTTR